MYRGTTPNNIFSVDIDLTGAEVVYITYSQKGETVIEKTIDDITITSESLTVTLTQAETLRLKEREVEIQIRAGFGGENGDRVRSNIMVAEVEKILKDGEI